MKPIIRFLLISCLSIIIAETASFSNTTEIEEIIGGDQFNNTVSPETNLKLEDEFFSSNFVLVWRGTYNDTVDVAVKIETKEKFTREMDAFKRLNAIKDFDIEKYRIPRVYYHGPILSEYFSIAMTLFEETLHDRFNHQNRQFSEPTILLIFKQTIEALKYIHSKGVTHNDMRLCNIFIRGQEVFLADFDMSKLDEREMLLKDYESLLFLIWEMVGVPPIINSILKSEDDNKLTYLKDPNVQEAFHSILNIGNINGGYYFLPNYEKIIRTADDALAKISKESGPVQFDWLKEGSSGASSSH